MTLPRLTSDNFEAGIASHAGAVAVAFLADWCAPCRLLRPTLTQVARQLPDEIHFAEVDVDVDPGLASRYHVEVLPTLIAFRHGRPMLRLTGSQVSDQLLDALLGVANPSRAEE